MVLSLSRKAGFEQEKVGCDLESADTGAEPLIDTAIKDDPTCSALLNFSLTNVSETPLNYINHKLPLPGSERWGNWKVFPIIRFPTTKNPRS